MLLECYWIIELSRWCLRTSHHALIHNHHCWVHLALHQWIELMRHHGILIPSSHHRIRYHLSKTLIHPIESMRLIHLAHHLSGIRGWHFTLADLSDEIRHNLPCISWIEVNLVDQSLCYLWALLHYLLNYRLELKGSSSLSSLFPYSQVRLVESV